MQNDLEAEQKLAAIFEQHQNRFERYQAASKVFGIKPGSLQSSVFRLWFDERHAQYERDQATGKSVS